MDVPMMASGSCSCLTGVGHNVVCCSSSIWKAWVMCMLRCLSGCSDYMSFNIFQLIWAFSLFNLIYKQGVSIQRCIFLFVCLFFAQFCVMILKTIYVLGSLLNFVNKTNKNIVLQISCQILCWHYYHRLVDQSNRLMSIKVH